MEAWIHSRLEAYGHRVELPSDEERYWALAAPALLGQTDDVKQEPNRLGCANLFH
jgi:hypothetical protein